MTESTIEPKNSRSGWFSLSGLVILIIFSEIFYLALLQLDAVNGLTPVLTFWLEMGALFVVYGLATVLVNRTDQFKKSILFLIIFGTILFRLTLLPAGLPFDATPSEKFEALQTDLSGQEVTFERFQLFDNDIWRYLWDGHVWAAGINPYQYPPADEKLDDLAGETISNDEDFPETESEISSTAKSTDEINPRWLDIRENINYPSVTTVYPPMMQFVFRLANSIAPGSVLMMKIILIICELIGLVFLGLTLKRLELPVSRIILYAWNPLMIKVFAGSGHADSVLMMWLCVSIYFVICQKKTLAAVSFGFAILAKLSPVFLLPFVVRRIGWLRSLLIGFVVLIGYLPFRDAGQNLFAGFLKFAREWQFNAGLFTFLRWFLEMFVGDGADIARKICAILIVAIIGWLVWKDDLSDRAFLKSSAVGLGILVVLSPTVMPWYLSWVLPIAVLAKQNIWFYFSAIVLVAFHIIIDQNEYGLALVFEYGLLTILFYGELKKNFQSSKLLRFWRFRQSQI